MKFDDLMSFVKAGYKPNEIKELIELTREELPTEPVHDEETTETAETEDVIPDTKEEAVTDTVETPDYKSMYEAKEKELKELQRQNTQQNVQDSVNTKSDEDVVFDAFRSLM